MKKTVAIGVDFGISKVHCNVISLEDGQLFSECEIPYAWDVIENDIGEIHPDKIWNCAQDAVEKLLAESDLKAVEVSALSFSCFGDCFVAVDKNNEPLYPMLLFSDMRARNLMEELKALISEDEYISMTGGPLTAGYVFPKIYWMKKNVPDIYAKTASFFNIQQYILAKLGLEPVTDYSMAARRMMFDIRDNTWPDKICGLLEKDKSAFGRVVPSSYVVGRIKKFGRVSLPVEVDVVAGAHDAMCGFLGLGANPESSGILANNAGTYSLIGTVSNKSYHFDTDVITPGLGPKKGSYHFQSGGMVGPTLEWCVKNICRSDMGTLFSRAKFDASCNIRMARDIMSGQGILTGLSVNDTPLDIFTGMIESITLPMKGQMEIMKAAMGEDSFLKMRIGAGGAKSDSWIQLKANVLNLPVEKVKNLQSSSVGVASICSIAKGIYKSYGEALSNMIQVARTYEPEPDMVAKYQERYFQLYNT